MNRNETTRRRATGSFSHRFRDRDGASGQIHSTGPGRLYRVNARTPVVAVAALVGCLGAAAGPAYARFNIPTGASPSPLFGAQPFTQQMLLFEEFGTQPLPTTDCTGPACTSLPDPLDCQGPPNSTALDQFLSQPLHPRPTVEANTALPNPWSATISRCIGRQVTGVIEGRPPGENFAQGERA